MKYLVLIAYEPGIWAAASPEMQARFHQQHLDFHRGVGDAMLAGEALADTDSATTLRGGATLTDGPFAETAEIIGGFYLVQADNLDQVVEWCKLLPPEYALEIRPCVQIDGFE